MKPYLVRTIESDDTQQLLQFELENRHWFESQIEARDAAFYSPAGVHAHVQQFLGAFAAGRMHPCVITDQDGTLIGRANLKDIDRRAGTAEIGYRIAESQAGRGVATGAVRFLVELARTQWQLKQLCAYVAHRNTASARVLEKCQFVRRPFAGQLAVIGGSPVGGDVFTLALSGASVLDILPQ